MSGASAARAIARLHRLRGEPLTLKRAGQADITVKAKRFGLSPDAVAGTLDDAAFTIKIANAEIAASAAPSQAPRQGDTIGGYRIVFCDTRKVGEVVALHILTVAGGHS
jgi:hypothetical protein